MTKRWMLGTDASCWSVVGVVIYPALASILNPSCQRRARPIFTFVATQALCRFCYMGCYLHSSVPLSRLQFFQRKLPKTMPTAATTFVMPIRCHFGEDVQYLFFDVGWVATACAELLKDHLVQRGERCYIHSM